MNHERKWAREYLKHIDKTSLRKICEIAGFNDEETRALSMFYGCLRSEDFIADYLGMSVDAYHKWKSLLVDRLRFYYHNRFSDCHTGTEFERKLNEMLVEEYKSIES